MLHILMPDLAGPAKWFPKWRGDRSFLCFLFFIFATQKIGYPCASSATPWLSALFGIIWRIFSLFILSLNSPESHSRTFKWDSLSKLITGDYVSHCQGIVYARKKVFSCFNFVATTTLGLKQSLNLRRNVRLPKWLNFSRSLVSDLQLLVMHWKHCENNVKNCINP